MSRVNRGKLPSRRTLDNFQSVVSRLAVRRWTSASSLMRCDESDRRREQGVIAGRTSFAHEADGRCICISSSILQLSLCSHICFGSTFGVDEPVSFGASRLVTSIAGP